MIGGFFFSSFHSTSPHFSTGMNRESWNRQLFQKIFLPKGGYEEILVPRYQSITLELWTPMETYYSHIENNITEFLTNFPPSRLNSLLHPRLRSSVRQPLINLYRPTQYESKYQLWRYKRTWPLLIKNWKVFVNRVEGLIHFQRIDPFFIGRSNQDPLCVITRVVIEGSKAKCVWFELKLGRGMFGRRFLRVP